MALYQVFLTHICLLSDGRNKALITGGREFSHMREDTARLAMYHISSYKNVPVCFCFCVFSLLFY